MTSGSLPLHPLLDTAAGSAWYTSRGVIIDNDPYSGFNLCHYTGDSPQHYLSCREALCSHFSIPSQALIILRQTHSTNVLTINRLPISEEALDCVDAIVTNQPGLIIGVNTADCVPVVMIDPVAGVFGVAHAGWRGAIGGIVQNTLRAMTDLGADVQNIQAAIGPAICVECFEVGAEVAGQFPDTCVDYISWEKPHVNLPKFIIDTLEAESVTVTNKACALNPACLCTKHNPDKFFSARAAGIASGRIFTFIMTDNSTRYIRQRQS